MKTLIRTPFLFFFRRSILVEKFKFYLCSSEGKKICVQADSFKDGKMFFRPAGKSATDLIPQDKLKIIKQIKADRFWKEAERV